MSTKMSFTRPQHNPPGDGADDDFNLPAAPMAVSIRVPKNPRAEITIAAQELERQQFLAQALPLVIELGQMAVADLAVFAHEEVFALMKFAQGMHHRALDELDPEYQQKFNHFSSRSLQAGTQSVLQLQYLGAENLEEVLAHLPDYQILPPEKQGLIRQIFSKLFGLGGR